MGVTVTGKLNKAANTFQAGESTGFGIRIGVKYYDRETQSNEWTNYECAIFAKAPSQVAFYQQALVEGAIVEVTGKTQKIKQFQGQNGLILSIEIMDASIGFIYNGQSAAQAPGNQPQQQPQGGFNQPAGGFGQQPQQGGGFQQQPAQGFQQQRPQQGPQAPQQSQQAPSGFGQQPQQGGGFGQQQPAQGFQQQPQRQPAQQQQPSGMDKHTDEQGNEWEDSIPF